MARTDIHRPSAEEFDPEDYDCVDVFDLDPDAMQGRVRIATVNRLLERGYQRGGVHPMGQCSHCGARLRYTALMTHEPTKTYLWIGEQCLTNRFETTKARFQELRKSAKLDRERQARKTAFLELCEDCPALVWATYAHNICMAGLGDCAFSMPALDQTWGQRNLRDAWSIGVLDDIARKARQYGELSPRQRELIERLVGELETAEADTAAREAQRAQEAEAAADAKPVPSGLLVIQGEVLGVKWQDSEFGPGGSLKMLVQSDDGWKVWGTVPSSLEVEKGDRVEFTATVKPSGDDPHFGFFKRPRKAQVLAGV